MALPLPDDVIRPIPGVRVARVASAWFGHVFGGPCVELAPGDQVMLAGEVVRGMQRVAAVGAGAEFVDAWVPAACLGDVVSINSRSFGQCTSVERLGDGADVSAVDDGRMCVLDLNQTVLGAKYGEACLQLRDVETVVLYGGVQLGLQRLLVVESQGWVPANFIEGCGEASSHSQRSSAGLRLGRMVRDFDGEQYQRPDLGDYYATVSNGRQVVALGEPDRGWQWALVVRCEMLCEAWLTADSKLIADGAFGYVSHGGLVSSGQSGAGGVCGGGIGTPSTDEEGRFSVQGFPAATCVMRGSNGSALWMGGIKDLERSEERFAFLGKIKLAIDCRSSSSRRRLQGLPQQAAWRCFHVRNWMCAGEEYPGDLAEWKAIFAWMERVLLGPVREELASGGWVFLYCDVGRHRSATATCLVLRDLQGARDWSEAWLGLRAMRPRVQGIDGQRDLVKFLDPPHPLPDGLGVVYPYGKELDGIVSDGFSQETFTFVSTPIEGFRRPVEVFLHQKSMLSPLEDVVADSKVRFVLARGKDGRKPQATQCHLIRG